ncbi:MAG: VOC family protein [Beutenbergiaceae bacterium]
MKHPVPLDGFIQIALIVEDLERAIEGWCTVLGVPRSDVIEMDMPAKPNPNEKYRGEEANYGLKLGIIHSKERGFIIELHEPDQNPSTFREFLTKHGNGLHHLGFAVGDARDDVVADLEANGFPIRNVGIYPEGSWTILEGEDTLGVNLNIKPELGL